MRKVRKDVLEDPSSLPLLSGRPETGFAGQPRRLSPRRRLEKDGASGFLRDYN
jgi:hypothetical protein